MTEGSILKSLIRFAFPVFLALFLQATYGAVDLLVVGKFAEVAEQSGVATGSMFTGTLMNVITCFAIGITVLVGEAIGGGKSKLAGRIIGVGIMMYIVIGVLGTAAFVGGADLVAKWMQAPVEAYSQTVAYIRICSAGMIFTIAYNLIGAIFRGLGDSKTPLMTVAIACGFNIILDLVLVAVFNMGAAGAAFATITAQAISVIVSFVIIRRRQLPFEFSIADIRFDLTWLKKLTFVGTPVALQELLVGFSFIFIQATVNKMGLVESAAIGVGEKACAFLMLVASAYMQSMAAFVAQNLGAGKPERANKGLIYGIETAFLCGAMTGLLAIFFGDYLATIFSNDADVIVMAHSYLKAYGIDCFLTAILFCFIGYFNGREKTLFVMAQGIVGAFGVRVPLVYLFSRLADANLFIIGLATPISSVVQIVMCIIAFWWYNKRRTN